MRERRKSLIKTLICLSLTALICCSKSPSNSPIKATLSYKNDSCVFEIHNNSDLKVYVNKSQYLIEQEHYAIFEGYPRDIAIDYAVFMYPPVLNVEPHNSIRIMVNKRGSNKGVFESGKDVVLREFYRKDTLGVGQQLYLDFQRKNSCLIPIQRL